MPESRFRKEEIERERRKATSRNANVDEELVELKRDIRQIIETGTLEQLESMLELIGKGRNTPEGDAIIRQFMALRGGSRR